MKINKEIKLCFATLNTVTTLPYNVYQKHLYVDLYFYDECVSVTLTNTLENTFAFSTCCKEKEIQTTKIHASLTI